MIAVGKFAALEADFDWISSSQSFPDVPQIIVLPSPGTLQLFLFAIYFIWWQSSSGLGDTVIMLNQAR